MVDNIFEDQETAAAAYPRIRKSSVSMSSDEIADIEDAIETSPPELSASVYEVSFSLLLPKVLRYLQSIYLSTSLNVINSIDPPLKGGHVWFPIVPFKHLSESDQ